MRQHTLGQCPASKVGVGTETSKTVVVLLGAIWTGYKFDRVAEEAVKLQGNTL